MSNRDGEAQAQPLLVSSGDSARKHLLVDLEKWRAHVREAKGVDTNANLKMRKTGDNNKRTVQLHKTTKWKPSAALPVSTFGRAARVDVVTARKDAEHQRRLQEGTALDLDSVSRTGMTDARVGVPVTFPTAPRWSNKEQTDPTPDAASYTPRQVARPHSARAVFGRAPKSTKIVVHKGNALYCVERPSQQQEQSRATAPQNKQQPGMESDDNNETKMHNRGVSFTKAKRFEEETATNTSPGPAAYENAYTSKPLLSQQKRPFSASMGGAGRQQPTVLQANSLFYASQRSVTEVPGVGRYNTGVDADRGGEKGGSRWGRGVTIPKSGREFPVGGSPPRDTAEPSSKRKASPSRRQHQDGDAHSERSASETPSARTSPSRDANDGGLARTSIAARLQRSRQQKFNQSLPRREFSVVKGQIIYQLHRGGQDDATPGVGAYQVKDGTSVAERLASMSPRRPASANKSSASSRPASARSQIRSSGAVKDVEVTPGPGAYNAARRSDFEAVSFNRFLRPHKPGTGSPAANGSTGTGRRAKNDEKDDDAETYN